MVCLQVFIDGTVLSFKLLNLLLIALQILLELSMSTCWQ